MDEQLAKTIGATTRAARKALGVTQAEAAERVGISSEFYARIERGKTLPSVDTLVKMAQKLQVTADGLLGLADVPLRPTSPDRPAENKTVRHLARRLKNASPSTLRLINSLLREIETAKATRRRTRRKSTSRIS